MPSEKIVKLYVFGHQNAARLIIGLQLVCSVCVAVGESQWQHFNCSARKCRLHLNFEASRGRWLVFGSCRANQQTARQQLGSSWAAVVTPTGIYQPQPQPPSRSLRCRFY